VVEDDSSVQVQNDDGPLVNNVPDLSGMTQTEADEALAASGFALQAISGSGSYATYKAADSSKITVDLDSGRIVRTSVVDPGPNAKNYPQRWNPDGTPTSSHDTGEALCN
jgi:predicted RNA binding protein YcfA (HicA-like mRNA interferase family)